MTAYGISLVDTLQLIAVASIVVSQLDGNRSRHDRFDGCWGAMQAAFDSGMCHSPRIPVRSTRIGGQSCIAGSNRSGQRQGPPPRRSRGGGARRPAAAPKSTRAPARSISAGGAVGRGEPTGEQAAQAAVSAMGGVAPPATRSAATPGGPAHCAGRPRRGRGHGVQPGGAAQAERTRSDRAAQPLPGVAALRAAGPRRRRSRLLEAEGREGAVDWAAAASSRGRAGEAALAAGAKRRPARCLIHCAPARSFQLRFETGFSSEYVGWKRRTFVADFVGAKT